MANEGAKVCWSTPGKVTPEEVVDGEKKKRKRDVFNKLWTTHERILETEILNPEVFSKYRLTAHIILIITFILCCCLIFFSLGSPVTTTLEKSGGQEKWTPPDIIACPGHNSTRKYQIWYNETLVEQAGIGSEELDQLAESVMKKGGEKSSALFMDMARNLNVTYSDPKQLLKEVYHKWWYEGSDHRICHYKPFQCDQAKLVWILDTSLCLVWDNQKMKTNKNIYIYLSSKGKFERVKFWIGNLKFKEVINWNSFTETLESAKFLGTSYYYYQLDKPKETICQKKLISFESDEYLSCEIEEVREFWAYDSLRVMDNVIQSLRYEGKFFFKVRDIKVFNRFQIVEQIGGIGAILLGISCAKILIVPTDAFAKLIRSKKAKTIGRGFVWIILIALLGGLQYVDISSYLDNRYANTTGKPESSKGAVVPTVLLCGLIDRFLDYDKIMRYNVSYTMINLLSLSALYTFKFFEMDKVFKRNGKLVGNPLVTEADIDEMFAFESSPHENGQYQRLLNQYNEEYDELLKKLGFDGKKPTGYEVFSRFLKKPCDLVEKCTIGDELVHDCCSVNFKYYNEARSKLLCLIFENSAGNVKHPQSGEDGGFRIFLNKKGFGDQKWYVGQRIASFINSTNDTFYRNEGAETYGTGLFLHVKVRQFPFSSGPYGKFSESDFLKPGREYKFKYSAEKTSLISHSGSHCSKNPQCYLYRYNINVYAQMLVKKMCGCYICHSGIIPAFNRPCCETKHAYTCLTQPKFYTGFCDTSYYGPEFGKAYNDYLVNMYKPDRRVAKNSLGNTYGCNIRDWFYDNRSVFYGMIKDEDISVDCREPCEKSSFALEGAEVVSGLHHNGSIVINAFLSSDFVQKWVEVDNVRPLILLSLIAGGIGLILGSSLLDVLHFIFTVGERMRTQAGNSLTKIEKATAYFLSDENTLSSALLRNLLGLGLIIGTIICVLSSTYLELENRENPTIYKFSLLEADGKFPSVGICASQNVWAVWDDVAKFQGGAECSIFGTNAQCSMMFPLVMKQGQKTCMISNSSFVETFKVSAGTRLEIRFQNGVDLLNDEQVDVWVGHWGDIRELQINPQYATRTSIQVNYRIRSQKLLCCSECQEYPPSVCPKCSETLKEFCCIGSEGSTLASSPNKSQSDPMLCKFNIFYSSGAIRPQPYYRSVAIQLAHTQMPEYVETPKLNWANKFSLYGGFVGIYLGLNCLNLFLYLFEKVLAKPKPVTDSNSSIVSTIRIEDYSPKSKF